MALGSIATGPGDARRDDERLGACPAHGAGARAECDSGKTTTLLETGNVFAMPSTPDHGRAYATRYRSAHRGELAIESSVENGARQRHTDGAGYGGAAHSEIFSVLHQLGFRERGFRLCSPRRVAMLISTARPWGSCCGKHFRSTVQDSIHAAVMRDSGTNGRKVDR
jgi:hypothetical protein